MQTVVQEVANIINESPIGIHPNNPDEVDLSKVQHLEHALTSVPLEVSDAKVQRSQRPRRPINYAKYHSSGQRFEPGDDGGGG